MEFTFVRRSGLDVTAYSDADFADKSFITGNAIKIVTFGGTAVSWASSTQRHVTFSVTAAWWPNTKTR